MKCYTLRPDTFTLNFRLELFDNGFLHGDCLTVTGQTVAENLASVATLDTLAQPTPVLVRPTADPLALAGNHLTVLKGSTGDSLYIQCVARNMYTEI
jgi:dihydroxyacid dehydratase/phosphogluconate dehydratase